MKEYKRDYPLFSLCGLNCGLCPRFHTDGPSKCPGCGGNDFHLKHPSCAVITCNKKNDNVEFCFQCSKYQCDRYSQKNKKDSFITYKNIERDMSFARVDFNKYKKELDEKVQILEDMLLNYNDGKKKNFYCCAVNLLSLTDCKEFIFEIKNNIDPQCLNIKDKMKLIVDLINKKAEECGVELKLRK